MTVRTGADGTSMAPTMKRLSIERTFPARISRSLTRALGIIVACVMLVGGASVTLALRLYQNVDASSSEISQILKLNQVHSVFDELIFELHQIDSARTFDRTGHALLIQEGIARQLDALEQTMGGKAGAANPEQIVLAALRRLCDEGRLVTTRLAANGSLTGSDLEWLNRVTHEVPRLTEGLARSHELRITRMHDSSQSLIYAIVALYVAFTVVGIVLVVVAKVTLNHRIATPLHELADAARGIADGRLDTRVPVGQVNEIGLLALTFNDMADQLQNHEREMRFAHNAIEEKVREVRSLYHIGTEIARLQRLDRVIQLVVDKARELLRVDAVVLRVFAPLGGGGTPPARSGPPEAFRSDSEGPDGELMVAADDGDTVDPFIRPEYARGHLIVPINLGNTLLGTIHVGTREEREFTADEVELLSGLATQAAITIERVRLSDEVRNVGAVQERERLAREMHDGLAQELGLLHLKLCGALEHASATPALAESIREMVQLTGHAYDELRQSIFGLRTLVSRGPGLVPTLTAYLRDFSAQNGIAVDLEVDEDAFGRLPPTSEIQVVRIIQEALSNVRKHARTDRAWVRLQRDGARVRVVIEDHGKGWDALTLPDRMHFGLQVMRERAEGLEGRLRVDSMPGQGTRVVATLPAGGA